MIVNFSKNNKLSSKEIAMLLLEFDELEKQISEDYENGEFRSVASPDTMEHLMKLARNTSAKDQRINIRLSNGDLSSIKAKAIREGLPYQTLISSILHKYAADRLIAI
jgi:predicted DNA binding CopG/RHH family protein